MSVSPAKVKDTAELFYLKNQRKISLRYLAWYFLNMDVQVRFPKLGLSQAPCMYNAGGSKAATAVMLYDRMTAAHSCVHA